MTTICPKCSSHYQTQTALIPPTGHMMRCPACQHTFAVRAGTAAEREDEFTPPGGTAMPVRPKEPSAPPGIEGPVLSLEWSPPAPERGSVPPARTDPLEDADLPVPKRLAAAIGRPGGTFDSGPRRGETVDLPAPKRPGLSGPPIQLGEAVLELELSSISVPPPPPRAPLVTQAAGAVDLPAPVGPARQKAGLADLPAPAFPARSIDLPAPVGPARRQAGLADLPAPAFPARRQAGLADLPAPVGPARGVDLPAPALPARQKAGAMDLPAPVIADLPMPVLADLPSPVLAELPSPVLANLPSPVIPGLPEPVLAALPQPIAGSGGDADDFTLGGFPAPPPRNEEPEEPASSASFDDLVGDQLTQPIPADEQDSAKSRKSSAASSRVPSRRRRLLLFGGAASLLLLLGGGATWFFLSSRRPAAVNDLVLEARPLLGDDLYASHRKAQERLKQAAQLHPGDAEVLGLLAQAQLAAARAGASAELQQADDSLRQVDESARNNREVAKAQALRDLIGGKPDDARRALGPLQNKSDAMAAVYLGWVELRAGKLPAAEQAFRAALLIDGKLPAAQLGLAQSKQRQGDKAAALSAFGQVLKLRPQHFTAAVGQIHAGEDEGAETKLLAVLSKLKASAAPRELAETYTLLGTQALQQSRRKEAEDRFSKALSADPGFTAAQVALARLLCDQEKGEDAMNLAQRAVASEPKNLEAGLVLVRALLLGKKPLDAGAALAAVVKLAPKDARVLYWQGRREEHVAAPGSDEKAAQFYQKAVTADARYLDAYIALSRVLTRQGKATDALAALRQVAAQAENDPQLAAALGDAYLAMNDNPKAEEALRLALAKKPDLLPVRMNLSLALEQQGRLDEAEKELLQVAQLSKSFPNLSERRARLLLRQGRYEDADALYLKAAAEPGASLSLRLDAVSFNLKSHPKEAEEMLQALLKEDARSSRGHTLLALLRLQQNEIGEAAVHADLATRLGDSPEAHLCRGMVLAAQGNRLEAIEALALARRPPVEATATLMHARQLAAESQFDTALAAIEGFLAKHKTLLADRTVYRPEDVAEILSGAYLLLGDLLTLTSKEDKALRAYEQATRASPRSGEAAARLGRALYHGGKRGPAIRELLRAIQIGGPKASYALESYLLLGDSYREGRQRAEALRTYHKWLELAPPSSPERHEVENHVQVLGDGRKR